MHNYSILSPNDKIVRRILINQYEILKNLAKIQNNDEAYKEYEQIQNDLFNGYNKLYRHIFNDLQNLVSDATFDYVFSILEAHEKENKIFRGFCGNEESIYANCAARILDEGRFASIKPTKNPISGDDVYWNSHVRMMGIYAMEYNIVMKENR